MKKKLLVMIAMSVVLVFAGCQNSTTSATTKDNPTELPALTETPEATDAPELTATPEPTNVSEITDTPEVIEGPEVTETPETSEVPEPTDAPETTEAPESTDVPEATETPEATEVPKKTEAPKATEAPAVTPANEQIESKDNTDNEDDDKNNTGNQGGNTGSAVVTKQCEDMTPSGQYTGPVKSPFKGVALYVNDDAVSYTQSFNGETSTFTLIGASSTDSVAQVDLFIGKQKKGTFFFNGTSTSECTIENVSHEIGEQKIILKVTANDGNWFAYIDKLIISGGVTPAPTATPTPTATPKPTATPAPTATPRPTATPKPSGVQDNSSKVQPGNLTEKTYTVMSKGTGMGYTVFNFENEPNIKIDVNNSVPGTTVLTCEGTKFYIFSSEDEMELMVMEYLGNEIMNSIEVPNAEGVRLYTNNDNNGPILPGDGTVRYELYYTDKDTKENLSAPFYEGGAICGYILFTPEFQKDWTLFEKILDCTDYVRVE